MGITLEGKVTTENRQHTVFRDIIYAGCQCNPIERECIGSPVSIVFSERVCLPPYVEFELALIPWRIFDPKVVRAHADSPPATLQFSSIVQARNTYQPHQKRAHICPTARLDNAGKV